MFGLPSVDLAEPTLDCLLVCCVCGQEYCKSREAIASVSRIAVTYRYNLCFSDMTTATSTATTSEMPASVMAAATSRGPDASEFYYVKTV